MAGDRYGNVGRAYEDVCAQFTNGEGQQNPQQPVTSTAADAFVQLPNSAFQPLESPIEDSNAANGAETGSLFVNPFAELLPNGQAQPPPSPPEDWDFEDSDTEYVDEFDDMDVDTEEPAPTAALPPMYNGYRFEEPIQQFIQPHFGAQEQSHQNSFDGNQSPYDAQAAFNDAFTEAWQFSTSYFGPPNEHLNLSSFGSLPDDFDYVDREEEVIMRPFPRVDKYFYDDVPNEDVDPEFGFGYAPAPPAPPPAPTPTPLAITEREVEDESTFTPPAELHEDIQHTFRDLIELIVWLDAPQETVDVLQNMDKEFRACEPVSVETISEENKVILGSEDQIVKVASNVLQKLFKELKACKLYSSIQLDFANVIVVYQTIFETHVVVHGDFVDMEEAFKEYFDVADDDKVLDVPAVWAFLG